MPNPSSKTHRPAVLRYSPRPRQDYQTTAGDFVNGPAASPLIDTTEIWNLAYLSHDFDTTPSHPDPMFTVHVRRTTQTLLDGRGLDLCASQHQDSRVESLLRLPAPRFVHLIRQHTVLSTLPLFKAYGESWLRLIDTRSRICLAGDCPRDAADGIDLADLRLAQHHLKRFRLGT
jgi:hypothetical protein